MGVITYLFHRSEDVTPQRYDMFFLDVGENIHIHYRDLRIELSTGEFEEIAAGFQKYAPSVLDMIRNEGYRDGVLPNTNAHDTLRTFWDKSRLANPVKYNARRVSIEENVDGFHIHFRNYKLLLDKTSFREFAHGMAMALLQLDRRPPLDPVQLLELNDLAPTMVSQERDDNGEEITLRVDKAYRSKAEQALTGGGYAAQGAKMKGLYIKGDQRVRLVTAATPAPPTVPTSGSMALTAYIEHQAGSLTAEQLNEFKLRLLFLFKRAEAGYIPAFRVDDVSINLDTNTPSVDFFRQGDKPNPTTEYSRLSERLSRNKLFFVKPGKRYYSQEERNARIERFETYIRDTVASHPCVNRVYLLGSSTRELSGIYNVPFVHFDWVKLASDFDLLIELEPDYENNLPKEWELKFDWPRSGSFYAHLGDLGDGMNSTYAQTYPGVRFYEQMLETYLFFPSKGNRAIKDDFLAKTTTRVIFERPGLVDWFELHYPMTIRNIKRVKVASFNKVYDVTTEAGRFALKVYPSSNTQGENYQLLAYEMALLNQYHRLALPIATPVANRNNEFVSPRPEGLAVLFHYIDGRYQHEPGEPEARIAGQLLARIHLYADQIEIPPTVTPPRVSNTLMYWLKAYRGFVNKGLLPEEPELDRYIDLLGHLEGRQAHCHGDVTPRNFIYRDGQCWLIDFQLAGLGPAILDLADGMVEFAARGKHFNSGAMAAFLDGYRVITPLSAGEEAALEWLLPVQILAKQARTAKAHDHGFEWNADLIATLQYSLTRLRRDPEQPLATYQG